MAIKATPASELEFVTTVSEVSEWDRIVLALKASPGKWARVAVLTDRTNRPATLRRHGAKFRTLEREDGRYDLYATIRG